MNKIITSLLIVLMVFVADPKSCDTPAGSNSDSRGSGGEGGGAPGPSCEFMPMQIHPVNIQDDPQMYTYTLTADILTAECKPVTTLKIMEVNVEAKTTKPGDKVPFTRPMVFDAGAGSIHLTVQSPWHTVGTSWKGKHSINFDASVNLSGDQIDREDIEFIQCAIYRDGRPIAANEPNAHARSIQPVRAGQDTIVECYLNAETS